MSNDYGPSGIKDKVREEFRLFLVVFVFLALMFGAFLTYRRLILNEAGITYLNYGGGLIKAAIVAKIILIGQAMKVGKRIEDQPLIFVVLAKAVLFALLVAVFNILERIIEGLLRGYDWEAIWNAVVMNSPSEVLAGTLMVVVSFIPLFALWETGRVLGAGKLSEIFFRKRVVQTLH